MSLKWLWAPLNTTNILLIIFTVAVVFLYHFVLKSWWYFSKRNVLFARGWPVIGSLHEFFFGNESFASMMLKLYRQFPNEQFFGIYELTHPVFIIRDPDLIKQITTQDFDHFMNHQGNFDVDVDPLLARSLFFSRDQQWKEMRTVLSPAFTGNKMRLMFDLIRESTNEFMETLKMNRRQSAVSENVDGVGIGGEGCEIELKDMLSRYATNIIATCAFGLKVDAVTEQNNEFYLAGKQVTNFGGLQGVKFLLYDAIPTIMKILGIKFFEPKLIDYFRNVVNTAIDYRDKNNILRPDMIHLLMQARKGTLSDDVSAFVPSTKAKINWVDDDLVAQCLVFFFAGFETMSTLLCFMGHELASNPQIQDRLYAEIVTIDRELNGAPTTYEIVQKFKYLDMVVSETLRLWPPIPGTDRQVTKAFRLERKNGDAIELTTNDTAWLPIYGLHLDAAYWHEPTQFDPERFNDENKKNIRVGTYLPFGSGPRACIASRFALMVAKTLFIFILREYRIVKCTKTMDPMVLKPNTINVNAKDGFWVRFEPRNEKTN